ncbi:MAG: alanine--tRNA ligase [Oscillospiraceae bacterium]|nr:alanine--tRNA ligase [Oscillospiraceae bacterium]
MSTYGLNELRELFLAFFEEKGHLRLPSFSLIPQNDASLLLINSGMAPMKTWFTGEQEPPRKRVCTSQKCIRTGDIEHVGKTARHGTYFEMLGNFSFGDYFKHDAIVWCWEFLTERLGMNADLLYPSVYVDDDEAFEIWKNVVGISPDRIYKLGKDDNFWDHGSGPCGPCSEVYYDRGIEFGCGSANCEPGCECDRFMEIWNNVFTQFDNDGAGNYSELKQKNIDTGMGLERLAVACQGVNGLFEVDTVVSIINAVSDVSGVPFGKDIDSDVSIRIITDHIRSSTMMICDGVLPSNEGRGYVLRRLLRRAVRHGRLLGIKDEFLCKICDVVIEQNKTAYPDLVDKAEFIKRVMGVEEESFDKTIDAGTAMLNTLIDTLKAEASSILSGEDAFKLYDTYGFPLDLTIDMLSEHGITVDTVAFNEHMEAQRTRARKAREALGDLAWAGIELGLDNTPTVFTGYDKTSDIGRVLAIVNQGELTSSIREGDEGIIVLDKTPFYAEKGGQSADFGSLNFGDSKFLVTNVQLSNGDKDLHYGKMFSGELSVDDVVNAEVDVPRRRAIMRAHTATHLLHKALHNVLGDHVNQAGSLVEPDKLRFDFTHFSALTDDEISEIEQYVNTAVLDGYSVSANEMFIDDAKKLGATALFGEKYGNIVRVITMGDSIELCGGIHLDSTAKTGAFTILSEFSVASGVRRIEAITGYSTLDMLHSSREQLSEISGMLKANSPNDIVGKLEQNMATLKELRSKLESAQSKQSGDDARQMLADAKKVGELSVVTKIINNAEVDKLRGLSDTLRDIDASVVSVLATINDEKITIMAACGKTAVECGVKAGELIREVTKICGGSGGGKPEFAMGGAKDASKLSSALDFVESIVNTRLG